MASIYIREVEDGLYRQLKIAAAIEGVTIKQLVIRLVTQYLKSR